MVTAAVLQNVTGAGVVWVHVSLASSQPSTVQPSLSLHGFGGCVQAPVAGVQTSDVQNRPSLQSTGVPGWHTVATQVSTPLHRFPSAQSASTAQVSVIVSKTAPPTWTAPPGDAVPMTATSAVAPVVVFTVRKSAKLAVVTLIVNM